MARIRVNVEVDIDTLIEDYLDDMTENHHSIVMGKCAKVIREDVIRWLVVKRGATKESAERGTKNFKFSELISFGE